MGMYGTYVAISNQELAAIEKEATSLYDVDSDFRLDIDKSWEALHYTLCNDIADGEPPMGNVVPMNMDNALDLDEMEFGAFALSLEEVKEAYEYMLTIDKEKLRSMYNFEEMVKEEIYPLSGMEEDSCNDFFDYLYENFETIKTFYKEVLEKNMSIVFYIS